MKDRKTMIVIIIVLVISIIGLGIAFAAFSQTLTINGNATVEATNWEIVFEGTDGTSTLGAPTLTGRASVVTAPTIKNNQTEISNYSVTLQAPGDSVTYNFKIHNKGSFAANLGSLTISGVNRPASPVTGSALVTDSSIATQNANTLAVTEYKFYYTDNNQLVGQDAKDCLEPGESENVSLRITFASSSATDTSILPSTDLVLDNLGVTAIYNQSNNDACPFDSSKGKTVTNAAFQNIDGAYYTYETKSFIGTGVNNVIISENITSQERYSSSFAKECSDGSAPVSNQCPEGTTPVFVQTPAADAASAYCSGCRLMTKAEAFAWAGCTVDSQSCPPNSKLIAKYNGSAYTWWLADVRARTTYFAWNVGDDGSFSGSGNTTYARGVRPAVDILSTATITGSGTQASPYVITVSQ